MARPPRELVAGGVYHVVARGNGGSRIFRDDTDFEAYLRLLDEAVGRFGWNVLAHCLMSNHVHLLVETQSPNLPAGVQWLHGRYGRCFNDRHDLVGHLFQGRYKAIRQRTDEQLWQLLRYIARNPVEAGISEHPRAYRWSSYGATLIGKPGPVAVRRLAWFLGASEGQPGLDRYRDLVEDDGA
jgi:putative transposase